MTALPDLPEMAGTSVHPARLADWIEAATLLSNSPFAKSDVERRLQNFAKDFDEVVAIDGAWLELRDRFSRYGSLGVAEFRNNRLAPAATASEEDRLLQAFLAVLSYMTYPPDEMRSLFELVVAELARGLGSTHSYRIGFPAKPGWPVGVPPLARSPRSLASAARFYARHTSERLLRPPPKRKKDLGVDVVAWNLHGDRHGGGLHFLGQCATGANWTSKLNDVKLPRLRDYVHWAIDPVRFFAIPFYATRDPITWREVLQEGGLVLDRPRLLNLHSTNRLQDPTIRLIRSLLAEVLV